MPFELKKANAELKKLVQSWKGLEKRYDAVDTEHGATNARIDAGAEIIIDRIQALRRAGQSGNSFKDFLKDREVKQAKDGIDALVKDLAATKLTFQAEVTTFRKDLEALADYTHAEAEKEKKKHIKASPNLTYDKAAKEGAGNAVDLAAVLEQLKADSQSVFTRYAKWTPQAEQEEADDAIDRALKKAGHAPTAGTMETAMLPMDPRRLGPRIASAKKLSEDIDQLLSKPQGDSPIERSVNLEDNRKKAVQLLRTLVELTQELKTSIDSVSPQRARELQNSNIDRDKKNFTVYQQAKTALGAMMAMINGAKEKLADTGLD